MRSGDRRPITQIYVRAAVRERQTAQRSRSGSGAGIRMAVCLQRVTLAMAAGRSARSKESRAVGSSSRADYGATRIMVLPPERALPDSAPNWRL